MIKILASILAILLMIFPDSGTLLSLYQQLSFPGEVEVAELVVDAIIAGDIEVLKNMYSETAKSTGEVTTENIEGLINSFDGNIIQGKYVDWGGGEYSANGVVEIHRSIKIKFTTTENEYKMHVSWQVADTECPENVGLVQLSLYPYIFEEPRTPIAQVPLKESLTEVGY